MSIFEIITIFLSVLGFLLTAFGVVMWNSFKKNIEDVDKHKEDLSDFKLHVARNHPTNDQFTRLGDSIFGKLDDISKDLQGMAKDFRDALNGKADK